MGLDMKNEFGSRTDRVAQTFVFFILALGAIILLCGLAIDSGLLYLAKARMGRAVDGAALAAIGNFLRSNNPVTNRDDVALIIRNFATANYTELSTISSSGGPAGGTSIGTNTYFYNFNDGTQDANGQYRRFVQITMTTGAGGGLTSAVVNARCPVKTYFINFAGGYFRDMKVSESTTASRNPRLIMVVVDRSGSMLKSGGGAYGLPQAVIQFLDFFDTSSDYVGVVSFGSNARLEMPLTTNFITAGTNVLFGSYQIDASEGGAGVPGIDAEDTSAYAQYAEYPTLGVRRMKFGGTTAADDGIRLGMEQLMANSGFNDPDVVKYMVIFTDGAWNVSRTLFAAPGYTNVITCPEPGPYVVTTNANAYAMGLLSNGVNNVNASYTGGCWDFSVSGGTAYATDNTNIVPVPSLGMNAAHSNLPFVTNAIAAAGQGYSGGYANLVNNHTNDVWQSADGLNEPFGSATATTGVPMTVTNTTWVGIDSTLTTNYYTHNLDVWLPPGSVDYLYHNGGISNVGSATAGVYVSDYTKPNKTVNIYLNSGDSNVLVMPGYVADGLFFDSIDMAYPDNSYYGSSGYPRYRTDNFQSPFLWGDDQGGESQYNNLELDRASVDVPQLRQPADRLLCLSSR
jgi:Flp pilus assembly protein TadG